MGLHLLGHAGRQLAVCDLNATATARLARLTLPTFAAFARAGGAQFVFAQLQFGRFAIVHVLEGDFQGMDCVFATLATMAASRASHATEAAEEAAAEQVGEQVVAAEAMVVGALLEALRAVFVVSGTFRWIGQYFVRVTDLLEFVTSLWILVRVEFFCQFTVLLFYFTVRCISIHT